MTNADSSTNTRTIFFKFGNFKPKNVEKCDNKKIIETEEEEKLKLYHCMPILSPLTWGLHNLCKTESGADSVKIPKPSTLSRARKWATKGKSFYLFLLIPVILSRPAVSASVRRGGLVRRRGGVRAGLLHTGMQGDIDNNWKTRRGGGVIY